MQQQSDVTTRRKIEDRVATGPGFAGERRLVHVARQAGKAVDAPGRARLAIEFARGQLPDIR